MARAHERCDASCNVQAEVKAYQLARVADEAAGVAADAAADDDGWDGTIGPLNTTALVGGVTTALVPASARAELADAWEVCGAFCAEQWPPAVAQAVRLGQLEASSDMCCVDFRFPCLPSG